MSLFKKKKGNEKPSGLGRSVDSSVITDDRDDDVMSIDVPSSDPYDFDEDFDTRTKGLSDEIMEVEKTDRAEIDAELAKPKPKGLFGRKKVAKVKPEKGEAEKKPKKLSRKQAKAAKDEEEALELTTRLSVLVEIEELPGITKEDAIETARHQAMNHSERPSNCYFNVLETRKGYLIEVQEGVGRSYLPSVHKLAMDNPGRIVVVPMVRRKLTVVYSPRTDSFEAQVLGEEVDPPVINGEEPLMAVRGPAMTPIFKQYHQWFFTGLVTAGIGGLALLSSLAFYAFDPGTQVPPEWRTTPVEQLPVMQWRTLASGTADSFVARLEYQDGRWQAVRQSNYATLDVNDVSGAEASAIVGGEVSGPAAPDMMNQGMEPAGPGQQMVPGAQPAPSPVAPGAMPPGSNPPPPAGMTQR